MNFWNLSVPLQDAPALAWIRAEKAQTLSYADLGQLADSFAAQLPQLGRKRVGAIFCRNEPEVIIAYLGALRAGDAVILLNERTDRLLNTRVLESYRPDWLWQPCEEPYWSGYERQKTQAGTLLVYVGGDQGSAPHVDLAVLLSTSGSTGSGKMVRLSTDNISSNALAICSYLNIGPESRAITTLPFNYSFGMSVINSYLAAGATIMLTDTSMASRDFWDIANAWDVTSLAGVPYTYEILRRLDPARLGLKNLTTLTQAGGHMADRLTEYYCKLALDRNWKFFVMYGQTEASPRISYVPPDQLIEKIGSIGIPIPGGHMSLDTQGQLIYEGRNVMMGYAESREDLSFPDLLGGRLETGDLARCDKDNYFFIIGRMKRFSKIMGNRINLDEVERSLEAVTRSSVAVIGDDTSILIYIQEGGSTDIVKFFMSHSLRMHHSTFSIKIIPVIPHSMSGKKDYVVLEDM